MSQYTVIQDIEAEDKFVGPLTLKQFVFAAGAAVLLYISFILTTKHLWPLAIPLVIPALIALFLAWPWGRDQPTEIWLLAKLRFLLKPRRRIWDQTGLQELVSITVPKRAETHYTNGLNEDQVKSRLQTLAQTIDTRGWAIKGVDTNLTASSDRLVGMSALPANTALADDASAASDILDIDNNPVAKQLNRMVAASDQNHRETLMNNMEKARTAPPQVFGATSIPTIKDGPPLPALPKHQHTSDAYGHTPVLKPLKAGHPVAPVTPTTPPTKPAILELAHNDDLSVATIARQANKADHFGDDEVVVSLR